MRFKNLPATNDLNLLAFQLESYICQNLKSELAPEKMLVHQLNARGKEEKAEMMKNLQELKPNNHDEIVAIRFGLKHFDKFEALEEIANLHKRVKESGC